MIPHRLIDAALIDSGRPDAGELRLYQVGDRYVIQMGGARGELMGTRAHASEEALAQIACERIATRPRASVLVGGLGLGFTLAAALRTLGPDARVVVAELVPKVVEWNRGPAGEKAGHPVNDPRVEVREADVAAVLRASPAAYDAILLDVDNGPTGAVQRENDRLYGNAGITACHATLRSQGVLAVWSAGPDEAYVRRLGKAGFTVEERRVHAHGKKGPRHTLWFAQRG
jgi:spermidine synthase